jgi:prevent-host-death family protein
MKTVGVFEAKTHLTQLLETVRHGEKIAITKRGETIAFLVPAGAESTLSTVEAIKALDHLGKKIGKSGITLKDIKKMKEHGRP